MKKLLVLIALAASAMLTGCGTIETGNVGVRTSFGKIEPAEVGEGIYTALLSSVDEYTAKETYVSIQNLTPKAKDKLRLSDLDMTIYYETNPAMVADFVSKKQGMSIKFKGERFFRPGYVLIENLSKGVISDTVAEFDSLTLHQNRTDLEGAVKKSLQESLDKSDPGYFKITRVVASSLLTDPSVEDSIRKNIAMNNEIDTAMKDIQKKRNEAEAMSKTAAALTPLYVQNEYVKAIAKCADNPKCTLVVAGAGAQPLVNLPK